MLPVSIPRSLQALRFTSLLSFFISLFIVGVIFVFSFTNTQAANNHTFKERLSKANDLSGNISVDGVFNSIPLIIFSYMYQPLIPAIYHELKNRNLKNMDKVLLSGTGIASIIYILVGMFGFITFTYNDKFDEIMEQ